MTKLKSEISKRRAELKNLQKQFDELDNGDLYLEILTEDQKTKLRQLQAESAKKTAAKAAEKAKRLIDGKGTPKGKAPKGGKTSKDAGN